MSHITRAVEAIRAVTGNKGDLPRLSRVSEVPYTTVIEWAKQDFRPKAIETFEKLAAAAETIAADVAPTDATASDEAA